ncbi:histone deacetylase family protein [Sphingomonas hylomeconis]|uniref:Histone deacetylase n=1 Tax=Sphingomonas hylomeconis TaxID=1395958 RepID=A0ABV7SWV4_9SPHN|nr:histone deacetylase [Sphingomonas hylomeconis]
MIAIVHHPDYVAPAPARSTYQWNKNGLIRDLLDPHEIDWHVPDPTPLAWLEAVHDPDYVAEVLAARVPREKERRTGFPITPQVARRARVVPGGTYLAARLALQHGFAANSAGGSHHALAATGAGYCVFNDLAIAAVQLAAEGIRTMIVDCDVHQGDGTAALTAGRGDMTTYSIHAEKNFPVRKARSTLDVPLADGTGDVAYLDTLRATLTPLLDAVRPDLILYQAGVDPFADDRLGRLALTQDGLDQRERLIAGLAIEHGLPLASTVGGGYGTDALEVAQRHVRSVLTLGRAFTSDRAGNNRLLVR